MVSLKCFSKICVVRLIHKNIEFLHIELYYIGIINNSFKTIIHCVECLHNTRIPEMNRDWQNPWFSWSDYQLIPYEAYHYLSHSILCPPAWHWYQVHMAPGTRAVCWPPHYTSLYRCHCGLWGAQGKSLAPPISEYNRIGIKLRFYTEKQIGCESRQKLSNNSIVCVESLASCRPIIRNIFLVN